MTADVGGLQPLFAQVESQHPRLRAARLNSTAARMDVEAIGRRRWPTLSMVVESDSGGKNSTPSQYLQVEQPLYDAGRLDAQVDEAQAGADSSAQAAELERQRIFLELVGAWQSYVSSSERLRIAQDIHERMAQYRSMMQRRVAADASPSIDLTVVESRLSQVQTEIVQWRAAMKTALSKLQKLSGQSESELAPYLRMPLPSAAVMQDVTTCIASNCWESALDEHPQVVRAQLDAKAVDYRLRAKEAERWPTAYLRLTQPVDVGSGNARSSNMGGSAFVGMRYVPGAGFESLVQERALASRLASAQESVEDARREVAEAHQGDATEFLSNKARFEANRQVVDGSARVLDSFVAQFSAARKTWLDLLNAARELSQSQYALVDAQMGLIAALYRMEIRSGGY